MSPRRRRRVLRAGGAVLVLGAVGAAVALLPSHAKQPPLVHLDGPGEAVTVPGEVALTAARRRAINATLDVFVPAAVERRQPLRALPLVTHAFRAGTSDASWARGDLPVLPYAPKGTTFHGWTLNYAYAREMSIELMLHPSEREKLGALASTVVFKRVHGRWLIDAFVPSASFAPERHTPRILAQPDFGTDAKASLIDKPALDKRWLLVPASVLLAALLVPVGVGLAHWRRGRRALRAYRLSSR